VSLFYWDTIAGTAVTGHTGVTCGIRSLERHSKPTRMHALTCGQTVQFSDGTRSTAAHTVEKCYRCAVCGQVFTDFSAVTKHHMTMNGFEDRKCAAIQ